MIIDHGYSRCVPFMPADAGLRGSMTELRYAFLVTLALAAGGATARADEPKTLGIATLQVKDAEESLRRVANTQLRNTLQVLSDVDAVDVKLPDGASSADLNALKKAATAMLLDRIVGGEVTFTGESGRVRLLSVAPKAGKPIVVTRELPNRAPEELANAVEAAACEAAEMPAGRCQGTLKVAGAGERTELIVDGQVVATAPFKDVKVAIGPHLVQLRQGPAASIERRIYVHLDASVALRAENTCDRLFLLSGGEKAACDDSQLSTVVIETVVVPAQPINLAALGTLAGGVALLAGGLVLGLQAVNRAADIERAYNGPGLTAADQPKIQEMRTAGTAATALLVVGGLAAVGGGAWFAVSF